MSANMAVKRSPPPPPISAYTVSKNEDGVKLANTLSITVEKMESRFKNDFMPVLPPASAADPIISSNLAQLTKPNKIVRHQLLKYRKNEPKKAKWLDFEIDEPFKAMSRLEHARAKANKPNLADIFANPNSPSSNEGEAAATTPTSDAVTNASVTAASLAKMEEEEGQYEDVGTAEELLEEMLYNHEIDAADAELEKERENVGNDGIFQRAHPHFDYSVTDSAEATIVRRTPVSMWHRDPSLQFLVSIQSLQFSLPNIEPFFCTIALYDLKKSFRLSEDFHFDLNDSSLLTGQMEVASKLADPFTMSKHAIFGITDRHEGVYLVMKVERVLQGDPAETDVYFKSKVKTSQEVALLQQKTREKLLFLSEYRQPFAWGLLQLFEENGEFKNPNSKMSASTNTAPTTNSINLRMDKIYQYSESLKEDLFISMARETVQDGGKKQKQFPTTYFGFRIDELDTDLPDNRMDSSSIQLKNTENIFPLPMIAELNVVNSTGSPSPTHASNVSNIPVVCKEVEEFLPQSSLPTTPHTAFVNLMYVYPEFVKFEKFRNISCRVQIRSSDQSLDNNSASEGIPIILGKSSTSLFLSSALTQVNYHKKSCTLQEEIKIILPLGMPSTSIHLFFTFYQVSCKTKPGSKECIGYAALPLYQRNRIVNNDGYGLTIASKLPKSNYLLSYLEGKDDDNCHFYPGKNFQVRIKVLSSLYLQDDAFYNFLLTFPTPKELTAIGASKGHDLCLKAIDSLLSTNPATVISFLPSILDYLFSTLLSRSNSFSQNYVFTAIFRIVDRVCCSVSEGYRCPLLLSYIQYRFENDKDEAYYAVLTKLWLQALVSDSNVTAASPLPEMSTFVYHHKERHNIYIQYSWFFFEVLLKSLSLERLTKSQLNPTSQEEFITHFGHLINIFLAIIQKHRSIGLVLCKTLMSNVSLFLMDCFAVLSHKTVNSWLEIVIKKLFDTTHDPIMTEMKFNFYTILIDSCYFCDVMVDSSMQASLIEFASAPIGAGVTRGSSRKNSIALSSGEGGINLDTAGGKRDQFNPVISKIRAHYSFISLFIDDFVTSIHSKEAIIRDKIIDTLRAFLTKCDFDARWQDKRSHIAIMFFPLIPNLMDEIEMIQSEFGLRSRRNLLICISWILQFLPLPILRGWWKYEDVEDVLDFLQLMDVCINAFHYDGIQAKETTISESSTILCPETYDYYSNHGTSTTTTQSQHSHSAATGTNLFSNLNNIESLMSNIHKTRTMHATRSRPQSSDKDRGSGSVDARSSDAKGYDSQTVDGRSDSKLRLFQSSVNSVSNKNSLRQMRSQLVSHRNSQSTYRNTYNNTISQSSREFTMQIVQWEGNLTNTINHILLNVFFSFMQDFKNEIGSHTALISCQSLFITFFSSHQSNSFLCTLFPVLFYFLHHFGPQLQSTSQRKRHFGQLANHIFRTCAFTSKKIRKYATFAIFQLLLQEYNVEKDLTYLQIQLTISLSKMTETLKVIHEKCLTQSLSALKLMCTQPFEWKSKFYSIFSNEEKPTELIRDFEDKLKTLVERLSIILNDSMEITRQSKLGDGADTTITEHLFCQLANAFNHIVEIRMEWLIRLAKHHQSKSNFAEAGQCYLMIAELVKEKIKTQIEERALESAEINGADTKSKPSKSQTRLNVNSSSMDSVEVLERVLQGHYHSACQMLDHAELYEQCSDVYSTLVPLYHVHRNYRKLSKAHLHLHNVFEKLIAANDNQTRMLGTYYRVGFYGKKFGDRLNGNEFIYKMPKITQLSEIASRMKSMYSHQLRTSVRILPDSNPVDPSKFDENECVMQVTFVRPFFDVAELPQRGTFIEQNTNLIGFKYSTPFTVGGSNKTHGTVADQHKRNTVLYVKSAFPYILTAQRVVKRVETILNPIESATEDVNLRTAALLEVLEKDSVNVKVLTGILAGSVATQVHGGAKEICQAFLAGSTEPAAGSPDATKTEEEKEPTSPPSTAKSQYSEESQEKLREAMRSFLAACSRALEVNKRLCGSDNEREFQANLDSQFEEMSAQVVPLINPHSQKRTNKKKARKGVRFDAEEKVSA